MLHVRPPETGYAAIIALAINDAGKLVEIAGGSAEKAERAAKGTLKVQQEALERAREQHAALASQFQQVTASLSPAGAPAGAPALRRAASKTPSWLLPALGLGAVVVVVARRRRR